jgi:hypothetical protein
MEQGNKAEQNLARQHAARLAAVRRTASQRREEAPKESLVGRLGSTPIFAQMGGRVGMLAQNLGLANTKFMKMAPLIGAVVAAGAGLFKLFKKGVQVFREFEHGAARVTTLLSDTQMGQMPEALGLLQDVSVSIGAPLTDLQNTLYNIISAVPAFR